MIHIFSKIFSNITRLFKIGVVMVMLFTGVNQNVKAQLSGFPTGVTNPGGFIGFMQNSTCAPVTLDLVGQYLMDIPNSHSGIASQIRFDIDWGDGSPIVEVIPQVTTPTGSSTLYTFAFNGSASATAFRHEYVRGLLQCQFEIKVWIKANSSAPAILEQKTYLYKYHQTDDYYGKQPLQLIHQATGKGTLADPYLVCAGQETCLPGVPGIQFHDLTPLNCNPQPPPTVLFTKNDEPRVIQFLYGWAGDMGKDADGNNHTSYIPNVTVMGVTITGTTGNIVNTRYDGGTTASNSSDRLVINTPGPTTGAITNQICIGKTTAADVGKRFYVRIYNWNKCNSTSLGWSNFPNGSPTDAYRNFAVVQDAVIEIVAGPPKPDDKTVEFCYETPNTDYTYSVEHSQLLGNTWYPGVYHWYDSQTATTPIYSSGTITGAASDRDFNPTSSPTLAANKWDPQTIAATGGSKTYYVSYQYTGSAHVQCESTRAEIVFVRRARLTQPANQTNLVACENGLLTIYAAPATPNPTNAPSYTYGGQTEYVWSVPSDAGLELTGNYGTNGVWAEVRITRPVAAGSTGTASVNVLQQYKDPSYNGSNCPTDNRTLSIRVIPEPKAKIGTDATYCPNEKGKIVISEVGGRAGVTSFEMYLEQAISGGATSTFGPYTVSTTGDYTINNLGPHNGQTVTYKIKSLSETSGTPKCASTPSGTATLTWRDALDLGTNKISGHTDLCDGAQGTFQLTNAAGNAALGDADPYRYVWSNTQTNTQTVQNSDEIKYTFTNTGTATVTYNVEVMLRYATPAIANVGGTQQSGTAPENYCPSPAKTHAVTIYPKPTASISGEYVVCPVPGTATIPVTLTGVTGQNWIVSYRIGAGPVRNTPPITTAVGATITVAATDIPAGGDYTMTLTNVVQNTGTASPETCPGSVSGSARIQVFPLVKAQLEGNLAVCSNVDPKEANIQIRLEGAPSGARYSVTYTTDKPGGGTVTITSTGTASIVYDMPVPFTELKVPANDGDADEITVITLTGVSLTNYTSIFNTQPVPPCTGTITPGNVNVTVVAPAIAKIITSVEICGALSTEDLHATPVTGSWTGTWSLEQPIPPGHTTGIGAPLNDPVRTFTPGAAGIYKIRWTVNSTGGTCDSNYDVVDYVWGVTPNEPVPGGPYAPQCGVGADNSIRLRADPARPGLETGEWSVSPSNAGTGSVTFSDLSDERSYVHVTAVGTYTLRWTLSSGNFAIGSGLCEPRFNDVDVVFKVVPVIDPFTAPLDYCPNDEIKILLKTTNTHNDQTTYSISAAPGANNPLNLVYNPSPSPFVHSAPGAYHFRRPNAPINDGTTSDFYTTKVRAHFDGCTSDDYPFTIEIKPTPELMQISKQNYCPNERVTFSLRRDIDNDVQYIWHNTTPGIGLAQGGANDSPPVWQAFTDPGYDSPPRTYSFTTATNNTDAAITGNISNLQARVRGCLSNILTLTINVQPTPVINTITDVTLCPNVVYNSSNSQYRTFTTTQTALQSSVDWSWTYANTAGQVGSTATNPPASGNSSNFVGAFTANENRTTDPYKGKVTVTASTKIYECKDTKSFDIIVNPRPLVTIPAAEMTQTECAVRGTTGNWKDINISSQLPGSTSYNWRQYVFDAVTNVQSDPSTFGIIPVPPPPTVIQRTFGDNSTANTRVTRIRIAGMSNGCASDTVTVNLNLLPLPKITVPANQIYCGGENVLQTNNTFVSTTSNTNFTWTNSNPDIGLATTKNTTNPLDFFVAKVNEGTTDVVSTITVWGEKNGCGINAAGDPLHPETYTITVHPTPMVADITDVYVCAGIASDTRAFTLKNTHATVTPTYSWVTSSTAVGGAPVALSTNGTGSPFPSFTGNPDGVSREATVTVSATATYTSGKTCSHSSGNNTFKLYLRPTPVITNPPAKVLVCPGDPISQVTWAFNTGSPTVQWSIDDPLVSSTNPAAGLPVTVPATSLTAVADPAWTSGALSGNGNIPQFWAAPRTASGAATSLKATVTYRPFLNGCGGAEGKYEIELKPRPVVSVTPAASAYCDNVSVFYNPSSTDPHIPAVHLPEFSTTTASADAISYRWYKDGTVINTGTPWIVVPLTSDPGTGRLDALPSFTTLNTSINKQSAVTSNFAVEAVLNGCYSERATFTITVKPKPQIGIPEPLVVCAGSGNVAINDGTIKPDVFSTIVDPSYPFTVANVEYMWRVKDVTPGLTSWPTPNELNLQNPADGIWNTIDPVTDPAHIPAFKPDINLGTNPGATPPVYNTLWGNRSQVVNFEAYVELNGCPSDKRDVFVTINPLPITKIDPTASTCIKDDNGYEMLYRVLDGATKADSRFNWGVESINDPTPTAAPYPFPTPTGTFTQEYVQIYKYPRQAVWEGNITVQERNGFTGNVFHPLGCVSPLIKHYVKTVPAPKVTFAPVDDICSGENVQIQALVDGQPLPPHSVFGDPAYNVGHADFITLTWWPGRVQGTHQSLSFTNRYDNHTGIPVTEKVELAAKKGSCEGNFQAVTFKILPLPSQPQMISREYCSNEDPWNMIVVPTTGYDVKWYLMDYSVSPVTATHITSAGPTDFTVNMKNRADAGTVPMPVNDVDIIYGVSQITPLSMGTKQCESKPREARMTVLISPPEPTKIEDTYCFEERNYQVRVIEGGGNTNNIAWYRSEIDGFDKVRFGNPLSVGYTDGVTGASPEIPGSPPTYTPYVFWAAARAANGCESERVRVPLTIYPHPKIDFDITDGKGNVVTTGCSPWNVVAINKSASDKWAHYQWAWEPMDTTNMRLPGNPGVYNPGNFANMGYVEFNHPNLTHTYVSSTTTTGSEPRFLKLIGVSNINKSTISGRYCRSELEKALTIAPGVSADFDLTPTTEGCDPLTVYFTSTSTNAYNYRWYWHQTVSPPYPGNPLNDGPIQQPNQTDPNSPLFGRIEPNPVFRFVNNGQQDYHVWLQVDNNICFDNKKVVISVFPTPKASFTADKDEVCPPELVVFTNKSPLSNPSDTKYEWNVGDGNPTVYDDMSPYTHEFASLNATAPMPYMIMLTASFKYPSLINPLKSYTCQSTDYQQVVVNPQVKADFTGDTQGCSPMTARFQSQSIGAVSYFSWNWNDPRDSSTGSGPSPFHIYVNPTHNQETVHNVTLTVRNNYGCEHSTTKQFRLFPQPMASFVIEDGTNQGCQPLKTIFNNTSDTDGLTPNDPSTRYIWDYNDGETEELPIGRHTHIFTNVLGTNLTVNPILTAENKWRCINKKTLPVTVSPFVKADFVLEDSVSCSPFNIRLRNASQGYETGEFDFGDGFTQTISRTTAGTQFSHPYVNPSMYTDATYYLTLKVIAGSGCESSITKKVKALAKPTADFRPGSPYPADYIYPAPPIVLDNLIMLPDRDYLTYLWSYSEQGSSYMNNFSQSINPSPLDRITDWGTYNIIQRATAPNGICSDSKTLTINIVPPQAIANFDDVPPDCMPYEVSFYNTSKYAKAYKWEFGDGHISNAENPKHTYADAGEYWVKLTAHGDNLFPSIKEKKVVVHPLPQANFDVTPKFLWVGKAIRAENFTSHEYSKTGLPYDVWYEWDWGDGSPKDTEESPSHMYMKAGEYTISLTVGTYTSPVCTSKYFLPNPVELQSSGEIILPNVFKPRPDGEPSDNVIPDRGYKNYLFYPPVFSPVSKFRFVVYSRAGQLLYETTEPNRGWTGYFRGRLCDEGVYVYKIEGVFTTGQSFMKVGDILLLR